MQYGIHIFATENSITPSELAKEAEGRGYVSVLFSEHTHMPVSFLEVRNPHSYYWQTYDPYIAAASAAAATTQIKIGTGVSLILQHDLITLAKQVATLDQISGGRFLFGIGTGWLGDEMANHGITFSSRYRMIDEYMGAMKSIWTEDESEFHGKFVDFSEMKSYPKPVQTPHPPLISGGGIGPKSLDFIAKHCDGWMPFLGNPEWSEIKLGIKDLNARLEAYGRDPKSMDLSIFTFTFPEDDVIEAMESSGVSTIVTSLEAASREEALPLLDAYGKKIISI